MRHTPEALDFCSRTCALASPLVREQWRARRLEYWGVPGRREVASQLRIAQMAGGVAPSTSSIEQMAADALDRVPIRYVRQQEIRHPSTGRAISCVDFLLAGGRVLEVFGGFWHCDPRLYAGGPVSEVQRRVIRSDARKRRAYHRLGVPFARVWELDLRMDADRAVRTALTRLAPTGPPWLSSLVAP